MQPHALTHAWLLLPGRYSLEPITHAWLLLRYYTVAALGVVFCGDYTTLDTVAGELLYSLPASLWPS